MEFSFVHAKEYVPEKELKALAPEVKKAHELLHEGKGQGKEFTGWLNWPETYDREEFAAIKKAAEKIQKTSEVFLVIGIGGSYLGAKAAISMLTHTFGNLLSGKERKVPEILFAGHTLSGTYMAELLELISEKDISVNVISKSGTTTEPAIAFRFLKDLLEKKYGKEGARERIFVTTDKAEGALCAMAKEEGYERFTIPGTIGGRYSVLTPVGLLPMAVAGIPIEEIMRGAHDAMQAYATDDVEKNDCYTYAAARNILYRKGRTTEVFASYEPGLHFFAEWWKQLYGESEGKNGGGIFPATLDFSTDLHSVGQYLQDGLRNLFETVLHVKNARKDVLIPKMADNRDQLAYLEGKSVNYVNHQAFLGAMLAHEAGDVPCLVVELEEMDAYNFGHAVYFFEKACAIGGYLLGINPFDQPGVEAYKKNMFALLGKPGYEKKGEQIAERQKNF